MNDWKVTGSRDFKGSSKCEQLQNFAATEGAKQTKNQSERPHCRLPQLLLSGQNGTPARTRLPARSRKLVFLLRPVNPRRVISRELALH
jgi:hypothetical protein